MGNSMLNLHSGIYTIPDASLILGLPKSRLRSWVLPASTKTNPVIQSVGEGRGRVFDFNELIEAHTIYSLRKLGVSLQKIRLAHEKLSKLFSTAYPFAKKGVLSDGNSVLFDLKNSGERYLLNVSHDIQTEFRDMVLPFCTKLEFDEETDLAKRFWPLGKRRMIVVDPRRSFGRPVIQGTNILSETIFGMLRGGESITNIVAQYDIPESAVKDAKEFHLKVA